MKIRVTEITQFLLVSSSLLMLHVMAQLIPSVPISPLPSPGHLGNFFLLPHSGAFAKEVSLRGEGGVGVGHCQKQLSLLDFSIWFHS